MWGDGQTFLNMLLHNRIYQTLLCLDLALPVYSLRGQQHTDPNGLISRSSAA